MKYKGLHIILATTLFAVLLWFSVSMSEQYQVQVSAPLVIQSLPPGKAIAIPLPRAVKLTFNDLGWRIAKLIWGSELKWVVDLNTLPNHHALTLKDFTGQLGWRLGVQPISMSPESLHISLDSIASKHIAVVPEYVLDFREGYGQVGDAVVAPESVTVSGARKLLQRIDRWQTAKMSFEQLRQSIDVSVSLADTTNSLLFTPSQVSLRINVQQFAEKVFTGIPIELLSVPQNCEVILSSSKLDIVVRGGIEQLSRVSKSSFRAVVDYRVILADTSGIIQPEINSPHGVQIVKRTPERLQYVVRKKY